MALKAYDKPADLKLDQKNIPGGLDLFGTMGAQYKSAINSWKAQAKSPNTDATMQLILNTILDGLNPIGEAIKGGIVDYLEETYKEMWEASSYYTGNLRGSLDIAGDLKASPYNTDIEMDMTEFTTPKILPALRKKAITRTWYSKKWGTTTTKTYYYKPARVSITGYNYLYDQDPVNLTSRRNGNPSTPRTGGRFVEDVWVKVIKEKNNKRYK